MEGNFDDSASILLPLSMGKCDVEIAGNGEICVTRQHMTEFFVG